MLIKRVCFIQFFCGYIHQTEGFLCFEEIIFTAEESIKKAFCAAEKVPPSLPLLSNRPEFMIAGLHPAAFAYQLSVSLHLLWKVNVDLQAIFLIVYCCIMLLPTGCISYTLQES